MSALVYAYDNGCPLGNHVCYGAVKAGDIAMREWALVRGAPLIPALQTRAEVMAYAAGYGGSIPVMRRLFLQEGIPMTASAAKATADQGNVSSFQRRSCRSPPARSRLVHNRFNRQSPRHPEAFLRPRDFPIRCLQFLNLDFCSSSSCMTCLHASCCGAKTMYPKSVLAHPQ
jgi:hypothetical protein